MDQDHEEVEHLSFHRKARSVCIYIYIRAHRQSRIRKTIIGTNANYHVKHRKIYAQKTHQVELDSGLKCKIIIKNLVLTCNYFPV